MNFAENLRVLRMQKGLTQIQLAKKSGLSKGAIGNYEAGKRKNIPYQAIFRIANALECNPNQLIPLSFDCCPTCGKPFDK